MPIHRTKHVASGGGGGGTTILASDWSTATGTSNDAKTDGGIWPILADSSGRMEVIASTGLGAPSNMANVLRCDVVGSSGFNVRGEDTFLPAITVGTYRTYRYYQRVDLTSEGGSDHSVQLEIGAGAACADNIQPQGAATGYWLNPNWWNPNSFGSQTGGSGYGQSSDKRFLPNGVFHRIEKKIHFPTSTTNRLFDFRVFSVAADGLSETQVVAATDMWVFHSVATGGSWTESLATVDMTSDHSDLNAVYRSFFMGFNGAPWSGVSPNYRYFGGLRVIDSADADDWCGAYVPGE